MLGPLPVLHRASVLAVAFVVGVCSGAWLAHFTSLEVAAPAGALVGAAAGLLLGYALVHDFSHQHRHVRVHRRS